MTLILPQYNSGFIPKPEAVRLYDESINADKVWLRTSRVENVPAVLGLSGTVSLWVYVPPGIYQATRLLNTWQNISDYRGTSIELGTYGSSTISVALEAKDLGGDIVNFGSWLDVTSWGAWSHLLIRWNSASNPRTCALAVNNFYLGVRTSSNTNTLFERGDFNINGAPWLTAGMAAVSLYDVWISGLELDISDPAIRAKFIQAGKPVPLGDRGTRPGYGIPNVFYSGDVRTWRRNKGVLPLNDLVVFGTQNVFGKAATMP